MTRLILVRSDAGDGRWSLYVPDATNRQIASGEAPPLASGPAEWDADADEWNRPNAADYVAALAALAESAQAASVMARQMAA